MSASDSRSELESFRADVLGGLSQPRKRISSKYFYDERGSQLFDLLCDQEDYYPTRTELRIMQDHIGEIVDLLGPGCLLIEYGSGSSLKTRVLLDHLPEPAGYVPIDISREHLLNAVGDLEREYPGLRILPVIADYTSPFEIPEPETAPRRRIVYFPGSTIGNFHPEDAVAFMRSIAAVARPGGGFLVGVDLKKDLDLLLPAYNDREGVTAAFNLNLLARMNRELAADFDLDRFRHEGIWNEQHNRIESHLYSLTDQTVHIGDGARREAIHFSAGESIQIEFSYKYEPDEFAALAEQADMRVDRVWMDPDRLFSVQYLVVANEPISPC